MPKPTKGARLGGSPAHERLMLANLATSLFEHGRIRTTEAKARRVRPLAEKLITKAKKGDLHNRRQVAAVIRDKGVVHALFADIAPTFANRPGGYTRITKLEPRKGDNAPMAMLELVTEPLAAATSTTKAKASPKTEAKDRDEATAKDTDSAETQPESKATEADTESTAGEEKADAGK